MSNRARATLFALFTVSGFTGLIYESIWTQYLKLFLGHAAYAQALVLAIFMGGLALGSWICSRASSRWRNLLLGYAVTEAAVGLCAIAFHPIFVRAIGLSYDAILPQLGSPAATTVFRWTLSAALILPQTILLGMTFPLMVAAFVRSSPATPGRSIALLYFTNSIGAAIGVLASGFFLVARLGLPGTMTLAGSLNLVLAAVAWRLSRNGAPPVPDPGPSAHAAASAWYRRLLLVSAGTGAASFVYEMGWIRMLSLVLGSSTHAFELMLSAFIFGLAFGGLWVHRRIDRASDPRRLLAIVQLAMGLLALATLPLYGESFGAMRWLIASLEKSDAGYLAFNLASNAIALAVMLPATFCAGMTLPLITSILLREGSGEKSIGSVYAANTVGAIAGVFFAIHIGMPLLGLKGLLIAGAALDVTLGVALAWWLAASSRRWRVPAAFAAVAASGLVAAALLVRLDPYLMASGVYRAGTLLSPDQVKLLFHEDGKTATVTVDERPGARAVRTNGKVDSALAFGPAARTQPDEFTMILMGALPLALHPHPRTVANIGLGTGLTSHTLLCSPEIERLDTIEIEQKMIDGARLLSERVGRVFTDPRSRIHVDDAKSFFSVQGSKYDVIVSEPSNPWVSGVASLFSDEFYRMVTRHLNDDGLFVQWVQLYEIDLPLVASVMKALSPHFSDYEAYAPNNVDMLVIARKRGVIPPLSFARLSSPELAAELARVDVRGVEDLRVRRIGRKRFLAPFFDTFPVPANSDYFPFLEQRAAKTRFLGVNAQDVLGLSVEPLPIADMLGGTPPSEDAPALSRAAHARVLQVKIAKSIREFLLSGRFDPACDAIVAETDEATFAFHAQYREAKESATRVEQLFFSEWPQGDPNRRVYFFNAAMRTFPHLHPSEAAPIWRRLESGPGCRTLSPVERDYVTLFKAIGERDAASMKAAATRLLETERDITPARKRYVLAAALLGNVADGTPEEAARLWSRYRDFVFPSGELDVVFRALLSQVPSR